MNNGGIISIRSRFKPQLTTELSPQGRPGDAVQCRIMRNPKPKYEQTDCNFLAADFSNNHAVKQNYVLVHNPKVLMIDQASELRCCPTMKDFA